MCCPMWPHTHRNWGCVVFVLCLCLLGRDDVLVGLGGLLIGRLSLGGGRSRVGDSFLIWIGLDGLVGGRVGFRF